MTANTADPSRLTVERETIRQWAAEHDVRPVRTAEAAGPDALEFRVDLRGEERLSWEEFFEQLDAHELVVVHHGEDVEQPLDLVTRSEAATRVSVETSEFEARLVAGETVTTDFDERVVESGEIRTQLRAEDEGKPVVGADGGMIGMVETVHGNRAHINPEPGIVSKIRAKLGWGTVEEAEYTIDESNIERITDDEVALTIRK